MKFAKSTVLLLTIPVLGLSACNQMAGQQNAGNVLSAVTEGDTGKKLDDYIDAHNKLVGTFGFQEKADNYRKADVAHASPSGFFNVDDGWIGQGVDKLKSARAMSGGAGDLDAAADALIASMGKVRTHLADLGTYYSSKKYLDDKLARGKKEDPQMLAELDTAQKDFETFNALLDRETDKRDQVQLDKLKGSGNLLKYNTKLALMHAKKLADLFNTPEDLKNPATITRGDVEVPIIEQAIADAHQAAGKAGKSDPSGLSSLTSMIGSYRSFKQGHSASDAESLMREYNQAVDSANTFGDTD
jgi:hypothetical protein